MPEHYLVFDLETVPLPFDSFSDSQQEYLLRRAETDEEKDQKLAEMALTPMTGKIVCIGLQMMSKVSNNEYKLFKRVAYSTKEDISDEEIQTITLPAGDDCHLMSEKKMLQAFWKLIKKYPGIHLISFNGRNFDAPYLMLRSALHKIRPTRNLMAGTKFNYNLHTDLIDELTYFSPGPWGATRRFNFDFYARAIGITSPKSEGVDGSMVGEMYYKGEIEAISEYCLRDVTATWDLFKAFNEYLKF